MTGPPHRCRVLVVSDDRLAAEGTTSSLGACDGIELLPPVRHDEADVLAVVTCVVDEATTATVRAAADSTSRPAVVLVADRVPGHLAGELRGVRMLARRHAFARCLVEEVLAAADRRAPGPAVRVPASLVPPADEGFRPREIAVLGLLADGRGTAEIAERLALSERTVKNVLHLMMTRLGLRNRAHAVAVGVRAGVV